MFDDKKRYERVPRKELMSMKNAMEMIMIIIGLFGIICSISFVLGIIIGKLLYIIWKLKKRNNEGRISKCINCY
jgi:heme/copper-type cytochrome/quinol oxidase subunit 2